MEREKRGVSDFFSNAWNRMKAFFKRVFRGERPEEAPQSNPDQRKDESGEEEDEEEDLAEDLGYLYSMPFQFVQLANGSIPEIRFSENEFEDGRVRNFKRHLVDAFATQLNFEQRRKDVVETTVTGEHTSSYDITVNGEVTPMTLAGYSAPQREEPTVTVKKLVTKDHIRKLAPSEALNDKDRLEMNLQQMQVFKGGRLLSSSKFFPSYSLL